MLLNGKLNLTPLATAPATPSEGWVYYDSVSKKVKVYNGTSWSDL